MITVEEAKNIIYKNIVVLPAVELPLQEAACHTLAHNVIASLDIPAFVQSSMDGYAIQYSDKDASVVLRGEMAAGATEQLRINAGEAVRIFTGAPLPAGADTVVMQEKVSLENNRITIHDADLQRGSNVRTKGAEVSAGSMAVRAGTSLSPAAIGFLAGIGVPNVLVYPMPSVTVIVTGKELQNPGTALAYGQVYESNSFSLRAALQQAGVKKIEVVQADDDLAVLKRSLEEALQNSDMVLVTGGVSVGKYDFVTEATKLCGVQQQFHKVKQKPGKPLYFGMKKSKPVFGLPGNPSSVLSCFYNYVLPAIEAMANKKNSSRKVVASLSAGLSKPGGLTQFLKGWVENDVATPLGAQESFQLRSFAQANCLICLEEGRTSYAKGERVEVLVLPV